MNILPLEMNSNNYNNLQMTNATNIPLSTRLVNKILFINHRRTSMRLCLTEWQLVDEICKNEHISRNDFIELIENSNCSDMGLTYYTRLFMMLYFYEKSSMGKLKIRRHGTNSQSFIREVLAEIATFNIK